MWLLVLAACTWISEEELAKRLAADDAGCGAEVWYDGVDQDCDGRSDFDQDGDGVESLAHGGLDCWDDPAAVGYSAIDGFAQPAAADVHPGAAETWYDGVDADCAGDGDFDQDGDGADTVAWPRADGTFGDDCYDAVEDPYPQAGEPLQWQLPPADVNPGTEETWYDGTDADCDGWDDYDQDRDGWRVTEDCDDTDPDVAPDADTIEEIWYDDIDENCDGNRYDKDGDGQDSAAFGGTDCWDDPDVMPDAYAVVEGAAALAAAEVYPGAVDLPYDGADADCGGEDDFDADADGHRSAAWPDADGTYGDDCDDADASVFPGALDAWYDGVDSDCVGSDYDADGDGFDAADAVAEGTDCDDADASVFPGAGEVCDEGSVDEDCDGATDAEGAVGCLVWHLDADGDGAGTADTQCWCAPHADHDAAAGDDCDDADASVSPGGAEVCDAADVDEDCDGAADDADASVAASGKVQYFPDDDGDTYGDEAHAGALSCDDPTTSSQAWVTDASDCDDGDGAVSPLGAEGVGDGVDQDCDGAETCYDDDDDDGYLDATADTRASADTDCDDTYEGTDTDLDTDCDDADASLNPAAVDVADLVDNDCDGLIDEGAVAVGDVIITEVARQTRAGSASTNTNAAWFELYNTSATDIDLSNWYVARSSSTLAEDGFYVDPADAVILEAGGYAVFCKTDNYTAASTSYSTLAACDYYWGDETAASSYSSAYHDNTFNLQRDEDTLALYVDGSATTGTLIDAVHWTYDATDGYWPRDASRSMNLDPAYLDGTDNDDIDGWCSTINNVYYQWYYFSASVREFGTPGLANHDCP